MGGISSFYPAWKTWAWRFIRGAITTAIGQTVVYTCGAALTSSVDLVSCFINIQHRWSDPKTAFTMIGVSFISGFLMALGVALRDWIAGDDKSHAINKLPI